MFSSQGGGGGELTIRSQDYRVNPRKDIPHLQEHFLVFHLAKNTTRLECTAGSSEYFVRSIH